MKFIGFLNNFDVDLVIVVMSLYLVYLVLSFFWLCKGILVELNLEVGKKYVI